MGLGEAARLIGLDWGTSTLRAYLFGEGGDILVEKSAPSGVMHLDRFRPSGHAQFSREQLFEAALQDVCGIWPARLPERLPVIACGMVGSTVGWREAPYLEAPVATSALGTALTRAERRQGSPLHIVPGIREAGVPGKRFSEILRGEETQIAGLLSCVGEEQRSGSENLLIGLPGTHSKWVQVRHREIISFSTFVTGEIYGLLLKHSVVAQSPKKPGSMAMEAFQQGLQMGRRREAEAAGGILSTIFSTRSRSVLGELREGQRADYLSGLLIAEELTGFERLLARDGKTPANFSRVLLAGDIQLCRRYQSACQQLSWCVPEIVEGATQKGLWRIAHDAGLVC